MQHKDIQLKYPFEAQAAEKAVRSISYDVIQSTINQFHTRMNMSIPLRFPLIYEDEPLYSANLADLISPDQDKSQLGFVSIYLTQRIALTGRTRRRKDSKIDVNLNLPREYIIEKSDNTDYYHTLTETWHTQEVQLVVASLVYHELVHARQYVNGTLKNDDPTWNLPRLAYLQHPQEQEAHREQAAYLATRKGLAYAYRQMSQGQEDTQRAVDEIFKPWQYNRNAWLTDTIEHLIQSSFPELRRTQITAGFSETEGLFTIKKKGKDYSILIDPTLFFAVPSEVNEEIILREDWKPKKVVEGALLFALEEVVTQESTGFFKKIFFVQDIESRDRIVEILSRPPQYHREVQDFCRVAASRQITGLNKRRIEGIVEAYQRDPSLDTQQRIAHINSMFS
ncbi:MAG: hypothetical protein WC254_06995 [Candidatus Woesearchaeota archaeon]|jgi:hypothetical protein